MRILGISAYYHDSAAALIDNGHILAAAQEERFTRKKHDSSYPKNAIRFCLEHAGIQMADIDHVVFYEKPFIKFERLLETYIAYAPSGFSSFRKAMPVWVREKLFQKKLLLDQLKPLAPDVDWTSRLLFSEHHVSHAASAFFPSPFEEAVVLTMDGVGEWATTSVAIGRGNTLTTHKEIHFPHSLGLLYSAFTYYCGFKVNSGEYKLMGLAPYGVPQYRQLILDHLIDLKDDGSFRLDMRYFNYANGLTMTSRHFHALFGMEPRSPDAPLLPIHMDIAASIQSVLEEAVLRMARALAAETGITNLCLAGGVALNCVANGKILRDGAFKQLWIQPAAGDAGGALGAALAAHYLHKKSPRILPASGDSMLGAYLGPEFSQSAIEQALNTSNAKFETIADRNTLVQTTAQALASGKTVGWFQGRMEFGPRALGNRSILADPRHPEMQKILNLQVKYRESFRPFAPSVLHEETSNWFDLATDSPYMLLVADVAAKQRLPVDETALGLERLKMPRSTIPAVTHVDYSARVQSVHHETNPLYYDLIAAFNAITGCPMLINTSFNVRSEPIACSPEDAFRCFMGSDIDILVIGHCWLDKKNQDTALKKNYYEMFEKD